MFMTAYAARPCPMLQFVATRPCVWRVRTVTVSHSLGTIMSIHVCACLCMSHSRLTGPVLAGRHAIHDLCLPELEQWHGTLLRPPYGCPPYGWDYFGRGVARKQAFSERVMCCAVLLQGVVSGHFDLN